MSRVFGFGFVFLLGVFGIASIIILNGVTLIPFDILSLTKDAMASNATNTHNKTNMQVWPNIHTDVITDFNQNVTLPQIQETAFIHPFAVVIGECYVGKMVMVLPTAVCRGDEGTPIHVGDFSNMQDGVIIHDLQTTRPIKNFDQRPFDKEGQRLPLNSTTNSTANSTQGYSVYIGKRVSLAHDSMVHGPAYVGNDTFVGMKSIIYNAKVGNNVAVGIASTITGVVTIPDNKFVPPGSIITTQVQADGLPSRIGTPFEKYNEGVIHVNEALASGYDKEGLEKIIREREAAIESQMIETSMSNGTK